MSPLNKDKFMSKNTFPNLCLLNFTLLWHSEKKLPPNLLIKTIEKKYQVTGCLQSEGMGIGSMLMGSPFGLVLDEGL